MRVCVGYQLLILSFPYLQLVDFRMEKLQLFCVAIHLVQTLHATSLHINMIGLLRLAFRTRMETKEQIFRVAFTTSWSHRTQMQIATPMLRLVSVVLMVQKILLIPQNLQRVLHQTDKLYFPLLLPIRLLILGCSMHRMRQHGVI